jgi:hypothetical protein
VPIKEKEVEKGFLQKYWMYIVPVVLYVAISAITSGEPEAAGKK